MAIVGTLAVNVIANTSRFSAGLGRATRQVRTFAGSVGKSLRVMTPFAGMLGVGIGFGAAAGFVRMAKGADEFTASMTRSLAIMQDVNAEMRRDMERTAQSVAASTQFSASEAAKAYFFLASAGLDAKRSIAALPQVAAFAQSGNFNLSLATDLATDAQSAMGLASLDAALHLENLTRVTDALTRANIKGNATIQQFSEAITNKAGASARMLGIEIEELVAVLSVLADQGVKGADAGTRVAIVLRDMTAKAITSADAFKRLGVEVFRFGEIRPIADIVDDLTQSLGHLTDRGKKAALMALNYTNKNIDATMSLLGLGDKIRQNIEDYKTLATTTEIAAKSLTPMQKATAKLDAAFSSFSNEVFPPFLTKMAEGIELVTDFDDTMEKSAEASQKAASGWQRAGKLFGGMFVGFGAMMRLSQNLFTGRDLASGFLPPKLVRGVTAEQLALQRARIPAHTQGVPRGEFVARRFAREEEAERQQEESVRLDKLRLNLIKGTRTAAEVLRDRLADADKLLTEFGSSIKTVVGREVLRAQSEFAQSQQMTRPQDMFAPALIRGTVEAYSAVLRASLVDNIVGPEEQTAAAAEQILQMFPGLIQAVTDIRNKDTRPGTVEVPAG